ALKLAWAICQKASGAKKVSPRMRTFLMQAVGLAAMGTVADVVPLIDENRALVTHGLGVLKNQPGPGLEALMKIAQVYDKPFISSEDVAFSLGPRINAAGRLGQAMLAVELLTTDKAERAEELAQYVDQLNSDRQSLERRIMLAANKQIKEHFDAENDAALVLADREWNPGVIGIVAGRLADKYHRPVVLIAWDRLGGKPGVGSARSVPGFDLHAALAACDEHLLGHGGHAAAAGLQIEEDKLDAFRHDFCQHAAEEIDDNNRTAELRIDAEASLSEFTFQTVDQMESLAPFGQANARPMLCASGVRLVEPPRAIGSGGRHLSVKLSQHNVTLRAVAFGGGDWAEELTALDGPIDVAFRPVINTFRGQRSVELHMVDWQKPGRDE
ncbi:MAG: single-stranded-DNA-specific exonuclease RecJ, partial [Pirellulales bacterium]|nr:single-stranded-DNA-specific exonuclease RecJ [Pirellulales bacterium]